MSCDHLLEVNIDQFHHVRALLNVNKINPLGQSIDDHQNQINPLIRLVYLGNQIREVSNVWP